MATKSGPKSSLGRFKRLLDKVDSKTLMTGFSKTNLWCSTGNYALNYLLTGDYYKGYSYGRSVLIGGISGSGKSVLMATGAAQAQRDHGAFVVWVDTEHASDNEPFFHGVGVNTGEDWFHYVSAASIEDAKETVAKLIDALLIDMVGVEDVMDPQQIRPVVIVVDSYSNLMTETEMTKAQKGEVNNDQGQLAKQTKSLIKSSTHMIKRRPIMLLGATHSMASQDPYAPDEKLLGGRGLEYLASMVFMFSKLKLKNDAVEDARMLEKKKKPTDLAEDGSTRADELDEEYGDEVEVEVEEDNGKKTKKKKAAVKVVGIRCRATTYKNRFGMPNQSVEMQLVQPNGLSLYSGLLDLMLEEKQIVKSGQSHYSVATPVPGVPEKFFKKDFPLHADKIVEAIMASRGETPPVQFNDVTEGPEGLEDDYAAVEVA